MKTAFLDIETTGFEADNGLGYILCASMKMAGKGSKMFSTRIDKDKAFGKRLPSGRVNMTNDSVCVKDIRKFLEDNDPEFLVTYNGDYFDIPYINTRAVGMGMKRLDAIRSVDHFKTCRYKLKLRKSSLQILAEHLGVEHHKTYFEPKVWQDARYGDKKAMDDIVHHCEMDVLVLEECHDIVVPMLRTLRGGLI